jgi:hypothetical protein
LSDSRPSSWAGQPDGTIQKAIIILKKTSGYRNPETSGETMPAHGQYLRGNTPRLGSFPLSGISDTPGKPRIAFLFCSRGECGQILPRLPKYG